jgi:hypothetical protein
MIIEIVKDIVIILVTAPLVALVVTVLFIRLHEDTSYCTCCHKCCSKVNEEKRPIL